MSKQILIISGIVGVVLIAIGAVAAFSTPTPSAQPTPVASADSEGFGRELSDEEKVATTREVLSILNELYYVTQESADMPEPESVTEIVMDLMTESLHDKLALQALIPRAQKLSQSDNKIVGTIGLAMFAGFTALVNAEDAMVAHLRTVDATNPDVAEFQYQLASFGANQKAAFKNITIAVGFYPTLFWELSDETHKPTDPIAYNVSAEARAAILAEIDRLFGEDIIADEKNHDLTGETNSVIFMVNNIVDGIKYDTYAEHEAAKAAED